MSDTNLHLEDVAAIATSLCDIEQLTEFVRKLNAVKVTEAALGILEFPQMIELSARIAAHGIENRYLSLEIGTDQIEEGILDYKIVGESEFLDIVVDEMAAKGTLPFEKDPQFHRVSAVITAAQMVANNLGPDEKAIQDTLKRGQDLANLPAGTKERAEETKEFLTDLWAYLDKKLAKKTAPK
ncbi:MAG: hypothetical protein LW855_00975 [Alphaproteobacteria bacterium]|jgi:hypothetical protein|nr:hypothetical protein [Thalassospira sp.]MCE2964353.1 hypothetical protein [Alphaproteobacteria bacterium]